MRFVFLILHYKVINETQKCIKSILDLDYSDVKIVIVDNGSCNGTGEKLEKMYQDNKNIKVIISEKNLGFAKGNNLGFVYAKKYLKADFIIMANNDIIFNQKDFCKIVEELYEDTNFSVMGPRVIMPDGKSSTYSLKLKKIKHQIVFMAYLYLRYFLALIYLDYIQLFLKRIITKRKEMSKEYDPMTVKKDVILYGCCLVFSREYIEKFDGIDERTFLYCEEELLYIRLKKNKLVSFYLPQAQVIHNHSVSIKNETKSNHRKQELFITRNLIKSNKILYKELKKFYKEYNNNE